MQDLIHKHILVTGGTSGIGRATAIELSRLGAKVTFVGRDEVRGREVSRTAETLRFVRADLREPRAAERVLEGALAAFGELHGAVNAAAGMPVLLPLGALEDDALERDLLVELRAFVTMLRAQLRYFEAQDRAASVVNVSSINGLGASPMGATYSAVKAAAIALSKSAALDYAARGVRVNALVAGPFDTPMLNSALDSLARGDEQARAAILRRHQEAIPMHRIGRAEEAAGAIAWLLSDASSFVTGSSIVVDGGMTCFAR